MGRRGNRNKNTGKAKTRIARKKFRRSVCSKCQLCHPSTGMRLCYNKLYLKDPEVFINVVLPTMIERHAELKELKDGKFKEPITSELQIFKEIFCDADICPHCNGATRKPLEICYASFIAQTKQTGNAKQVKKQSAEPPVMMTIISNNDAFENEVLRILEEYNNSKRSAKDTLFEDHNKQHDQNSAAEYSVEGHFG